MLAVLGIASWFVWLRSEPTPPPVISMEARSAAPRSSLPPALPEIEVLPPPVDEADLVEAEIYPEPPLEGESPLEMWPLPAEWVNQAAAYHGPPAAPPALARVERESDPPEAPTEPRAVDPAPTETEVPPEAGEDSADAAVRIDPQPDPEVCPQPAYPIPAMRRGMQGVVTLLVAVDVEGKVTQVRLLESSGHGILDRAAQDAVAKWRFTPATEGGEAVPGAARVPIRFRIQPQD